MLKCNRFINTFQLSVLISYTENIDKCNSHKHKLFRVLHFKSITRILEPKSLRTPTLI